MLLQTRRLDLFPCSLEVAQAAVNDRDDLERLLDVRVPQGWPAPDLQGFLPVYACRADETPSIRILGKLGHAAAGDKRQLGEMDTQEQREWMNRRDPGSPS
jgi:hypothetical protein